MRLVFTKIIEIFLLQGWGFCSGNCINWPGISKDIYDEELREVKSTILSDNPQCKKWGLCARFVNKMNVTIIQNLKG